jgi:hypothetical protein
MRVFFRLGAFFVVVFLLIARARAQSEVFPQWTARFHLSNSEPSAGGEVTSGSTAASGSTLNAIAADAQGNSYIGLTMCLNVTLGCPDRESLTFKYDADGHLQWKAWLSGPVHEALNAGVAVDAVGNVYVLSALSTITDPIDPTAGSEFATAKYAPNGSRLWIRFIHSSTRGNFPARIAVGPSGNVYVTGTTAAPRRDPDEVLTIKFDTNGNLLWSRTLSAFGLVPSAPITGFALDGQENVYIATDQESIGFFNAGITKYDKNGNIVPGGVGIAGAIDALRVDSENNIYFSGAIIPDNPNVPGHGIAEKIDAAGHVVWENDSASGTDIAPDRNGNLYVASFAMLRKFDGHGVQLWSAPLTDNPINLTVNAFGDVYVAGLHSVTKYSVNGAKLWSQPFTGSTAAMTIGGDGALLVTGAAPAASDSGNDWITTNYVQDAAKLTPGSLAFGNHALKVQCAPQTVTLANTSPELPLIIKTITVTGDFHVTNNCPTTLTPGASCKLEVTFTPTELGTRTGALSVLDSWEGSEHSPQTVRLLGTGVAQ